MILFSIGVGAASPVAITRAISIDPQMIGAASGLYGFMQMANGALCTLAVGSCRPTRTRRGECAVHRSAARTGLLSAGGARLTHGRRPVQVSSK
jgi:hypothetical protein